MWQYVHCKFDNKSKNRQITDILVNDTISKDDTCKANYFNSFFSTVVSKLLDKNIPPQQIQEVPDILFNTMSNVSKTYY